MNKICKIYKYVFCFINSLILLFTMEFHYTQSDIFGDNTMVFLSKFKLIDFFIAIIFFVFQILCFYLLDKVLSKKNKTRKKDLITYSSKKLFFISVIIMLLAWAPYYLSFFPGGIYSDTLKNYYQAVNGMWKSNVPVLYTLFIRGIYYISFKNPNIVFTILTLIQIMAFVLVFAYLINILKKYKVNKYAIYLVLGVFSFYPRIPIYVLSLWKDSLFSIFLLLLVIKFFNIYMENGRNLNNGFEVFKIILISFFVCVFRNNGYHFIILLLIIFAFIYKDKLKEYKLFFISYLSLIICMIIFFGPILRMYKLDTPFMESLGIPFQQISYVVVNEKNIPKEDMEVINKILPKDIIISTYQPMIVDNLKLSVSFDHDYLESHKVKFFKTYIHLFFKYPLDYIKSYLYMTVGYWNYFTNCYGTGSHSIKDFYLFMYSPKEAVVYADIKTNYNVLKDVFHIDLSNIIFKYAQKANNSGIFTLLLFISIYICLYKKNYKNLIFYLPSLFLLFTLLLATPAAFSSRYIIYNILFMPFGFILPFIDNKKRLIK